VPQAMGDREIASDLLSSLKFSSNKYNDAILESKTDSVRQTFFDMHTDAVNCAKDVFNVMNARGWYKTQPAR